MRKNSFCKTNLRKFSIRIRRGRNHRKYKITKGAIVVLGMQVLFTVGIAVKPFFMVYRVHLLNNSRKKENGKKENR